MKKQSLYFYTYIYSVEEKTLYIYLLNPKSVLFNNILAPQDEVAKKIMEDFMRKFTLPFVRSPGRTHIPTPKQGFSDGWLWNNTKERAYS